MNDHDSIRQLEIELSHYSPASFYSAQMSLMEDERVDLCRRKGVLSERVREINKQRKTLNQQKTQIMEETPTTNEEIRDLLKEILIEIQRHTPLI